MISHTPQQLADLKDSPRVFYCLQIQFGATYYITTADRIVNFSGNDYLPGLINEIDEIEITSDPKVNDINLELLDLDGTFLTLVLQGGWMNKPVTIFKIIEDKNGNVILSKNAFKGFLSEASVNADSNITTLVVSSAWADFEKKSGIRTNSSSQQRFYPTDTGFDQSSNAVKKIYWGREAPSSPTILIPPIDSGGNVRPGIYTEPSQ